MSLLSVQNLSYSHVSGVPLLRAVTFAIDPGDRIGLAGANGSGKTTLLRLLAGEMEPDSGEIARRKGLSTEMPHRPSGQELSSGQRTREGLARVMRAGADLLLLDEPTNHLDLEAREWLAQWLIRQKITCVVVSHDRAFLNEVTTRTVAIERGAVRVYAGNYDFAMEEREAGESRQRGQYEAQQRRVAAAERAAEKRERLAAKVAKAPPGMRQCRDFYARKAAKVARTGRILRERDKLEPTIGKPWEEQGIPELDFSNVPYCSELVVNAEAMTVGYGEGAPVIEDLSFFVHRNERWAVLGSNGSGKTTLLRTLMGDLPLRRGRLHWGSGVRVGYYAQEHEHLDERKTPLEVCMEVCPDEMRVRTLLACLRLRSGLVRQPLRLLSLGERSKTALTRLLLGGYNALLLDEPTNHLEMEAQEALAGALRQYPGAVILVSHDRWFVEKTAMAVLELSHGMRQFSFTG
ncbi:MAG: ABC-F family ATP-binding cassette domain-containing protein [Bryobacterales bacterium]|nr:ABC-F family ATP-binding cassette domain-containing protein [Bryobacterales bacterium]